MFSYDSILNEAITKAQNGDFDSDGQLDINKLKEWVVQQFKANLVDFYPNGLGNMPLEELNTMFDALVASAKEKQDAGKIKEAAISYCKAVSAKGNALAQAVKDIFGDNYATAINAMLSGEIQDKMTELKDKVLVIGDPATFTVTNWRGVGDNLVLTYGNSKSFQLSCDIKNGNNVIEQSRVEYKAIVNGGAGTATIDMNGKLTIVAGDSDGYTTVKVYAVVDGIQIGEPKTIKVRVASSKIDWSLMQNAKISGPITVDGNVGNESNQTVDLAKLYQNNGVIRLAAWDGDWPTVQRNAKNKLSEILNVIKTACINSGSADTAALNKAYEKTLDLYTRLVTGANGKAGKKSGATKTLCFEGENYTYYSNNWYKEKTAHSAKNAYEQGGQANATGLQWNFSYRDYDSDEFYLNIRCLMDIFNKFYEQALTA